MRPLKLDSWGVSWEEYKELSYFCLQYDAKRREADALLTLRVSTPPPVKLPGGEGVFLPRGAGVGDPVARLAEKRERLLRDVRLIERAAEVAAGEIAPYILRAVTRRGGVQSLFAKDRPPCGERQFYQLRRRFFWTLREMRNGDL